eukprot:552889_1
MSNSHISSWWRIILLSMQYIFRGTDAIFQWSFAGQIPNKACVQWLESSDSNGWNDNFLCSDENYGIRWNSAGSIAGMICTQILESMDPHTWNDNYLCVPSNSNLHFSWSSAGPINNLPCVQITEPSDPHTWNDNYLCYTFGGPSANFQWSYAGPISNKICIQWLESSDPYTWHDNYLCSAMDYNLRWSMAGPIAGMRCTQILESEDRHTWNDNYLCVPSNSNLHLFWSSTGSINNLPCVQILEPSDPHSWHDNYLCYSFGYELIGCYADTGDRALNDKIIGRSYTADTCQLACNGYQYFSVQDGDFCFCEQNLEEATKHGPSTGCGATGTGGAWANSVYKSLTYSPYELIGCYGDTGTRALNDEIIGRSYTPQTCHFECVNYEYFSVQDGDFCFCEQTLSDATRYGLSIGCSAAGTGGAWANSVYKSLTYSQHGRAMDTQVADGMQVEWNDYSYVVVMGVAETCTGSILRKKNSNGIGVILTAAHCKSDGMQEVRIGCNDEKGSNCEKYTIVKWVLHEDYQ